MKDKILDYKLKEKNSEGLGEDGHKGHELWYGLYGLLILQSIICCDLLGLTGSYLQMPCMQASK